MLRQQTKGNRKIPTTSYMEEQHPKKDDSDDTAAIMWNCAIKMTAFSRPTQLETARVIQEAGKGGA